MSYFYNDDYKDSNYIIEVSIPNRSYFLNSNKIESN